MSDVTTDGQRCGERGRYLSAAAAFVDLAERVPAGAWSQPGLGVWSVRDLAGHTVSSALDVVVAVLAQPAARQDIATPAGYYALARTVDPRIYAAAVAASTESARRDGAALGERPAEVVRARLAAAVAALASVEDDDVVQTPAGGMRVVDWLATRTFELVVHGLDLAAAAGLPADLPDDLVADAAVLATRIAAAVGDAPTVLRAMTGRAPLPPGFSVV
jgi:uncharacterized protein (TIGR03083 family)